MIHPLAWVAWLGAVLTALTLTRNPFYLALILGWIAAVTGLSRPAAGTAPIPISPLRFAMGVVAFSALFNALTVHFGDTALFSLPEALPLLGGVITLEALVFGGLNGLVVSGLFAAFSIVNRVLPVRALIRLIPRAFYPVAVVASIAVTFVPAMLRHFEQIREAQAVRGHRLRSWRDWLPLVMPLLIGGLERALQLAEAMTARGFVAVERPGDDLKTRLVMIAGLLLLLGGWLLRLVWQQERAGLGLLLLGVGMILGLLWRVGRRAPRTVYRPEPWQARDAGVMLGAAMTALAFLVQLPGLDRSAIFYYPYPALAIPGFDPGVAMATLGLLGPLLGRARRADPAADTMFEHTQI
ncbi:MAG: energy-coupling factor transporter transmembrane component T [Chloroflexota bacterium]